MSPFRFLDRLVDPSWRDCFWRILELPARRRFLRELAVIDARPRLRNPALNYGETAAASSGGIVHGGRVKLRHLAEEYPAIFPDFNLLYLVSSAPPRFALELVGWAKARGVKLVWNQNGVAYPGWYGTRSEEINGPMRLLRAQADFIFYQSEFCRQCADCFLGPVDAPGEIAFNCVDTNRFHPAERFKGDICQLLAAGSHYEPERIFSTLETLAELRRRQFPATLHIAGRLAWPRAETALAEKIRALHLGDQVRRTAAYTQEEAPAIYQSAHILLHPKYKDPCPTVPIEAMACGVPVIGSASGGMPELVSPDTGSLIAVPESWEESFWPAPTAMADAVELIMSGWRVFAAAARQRALANFSREAWLAQHRQVFETLTR